MAFLKHVGRHAGTGQRLAVVFMQLPDDKNHALVAFSDSLPDRYHDDFMAAVESPEGQSANALYEVLSRKLFWHGTTMLTTLHKEGLLAKIPTSAIIMTPNSNTSISLDAILAEMEKIDSGVSAPINVNDTTHVERGNTAGQANVAISQQDENKQIAQNLLLEARLLDQAAEQKRNEALKYDPTLGSPTIVSEKKQRGRPKKEQSAEEA
jgi:hypothetical protein